MCKKFEQLSDWIIVDEYCATRIVKNGDVNNILDRVAFIEKSGRVRVNKLRCSLERENGIGATASDRDVWITIARGSSEYGFDETARNKCDKLLEALGWE